MGKTKKSPAPAIDSVAVRYDLFDLPTALHKAGLAGLILQIRHMVQAGRPEDEIPEITDLTPTSATIRFTARSAEALLDAVYAASPERIEVGSKWAGQEPVQVIERDETDPATLVVKKTKRFVYEVILPRGDFLRQHLPEMDPNKGWLKLWRDMLWAIPRSRHLSRIPYHQRAAGAHCAEGGNAWADLVAVEKARRANGFYTAEVTSSLWLGAQAANAEGVPFRGRAEHNLLLHFWPLAVLVFVPQRVNNDGDGEFVGFTLALPEVAHLEYFCEEYPAMLAALRTDVRGYYPAEAVIDLPDQAALEFLECLARVAARSAGTKAIRDTVNSVEFLHLYKPANNVKLMAAGRVAPNQDLLDQYLALVGPDGRSRYKNPLFRTGLLLGLLRDRPWYVCLAPMLVERPWPFFVRGDKTPRALPRFADDAAAKFQQELEDHDRRREEYEVNAKNDPEAPAPARPLALLIYRVVRTYLQARTEEKSGIRWEDFKDRKTPDGKLAIPREYAEAREKIASDAFLGMRSRREQDFVEHFTATFCYFKQYLSEDDFQTVAESLLRQPEDVKALTLLALSANS